MSITKEENSAFVVGSTMGNPPTSAGAAVATAGGVAGEGRPGSGGVGQGAGSTAANTTANATRGGVGGGGVGGDSGPPLIVGRGKGRRGAAADAEDVEKGLMSESREEPTRSTARSGESSRDKASNVS